MLEEIGSLIFPFMRDENMYARELPSSYGEFYISIDYGTINPFSMGLWGCACGTWYRIAEVYYDARKQGRYLTDEEYYHILTKFAGPLRISAVIIDPSAASFIEVVKRHKRFTVVCADPTLHIERVRLALMYRKFVIHYGCEASRYEFRNYRYDAYHKPRRENDHAMDDIRFFINYIVNREIIKFLNAPRTYYGRNL